MRNPAENYEERARLEALLDDLLQGSLGLNIYPRLPSGKRLPGAVALTSNAFLAGIQMTAVYFLFFGILPWFLFWQSGHIPSSLWPLFALQLYGAVWAGWATTSNRIVHRSVMDVIEQQIIPELSPTSLKYINDKLSL